MQSFIIQNFQNSHQNISQREFENSEVLEKKGSSEFQSEMFLYYYALYLQGEVTKEDQMLDGSAVPNVELSVIERELEAWQAKGLLSDLALYLHALVLKDLQRKEEAKKALVQVLNQLPTFWSAWVELARLVDKDSIVLLIKRTP